MDISLPVLTSIDEAQIRDLLARDQFFWLDLCAPHGHEVEQLGALFGLHELVVEDTIKFDQRPKVDQYGDYAQLVFFGAGPPDAGLTECLREVHVIIHGSYILTVHQKTVPELEQLAARFERRVPHIEQDVLYRILDTLTDSFFPLLSDLDAEIEQLEEAVAFRPGAGNLQRIFDLKRELLEIRRVTAPQRDLLGRVVQSIGDLPGLETGSHDYMRDVHDHMIRITETIDVYRDLLTGVMEVHLTSVANKQNEVMKELSVMATIFLPLTFITGFFGQNFGWLVDNVDTRTDFLVFGGGSLLIPALLLLVYFRRRGYI